MAQVFHKKEQPFAYGKYKEDKFKVKAEKSKEKRIQTVLEVLGADFEYAKIAVRKKEVEFRGSAKDIFDKRKRVVERVKVMNAQKENTDEEKPQVEEDSFDEVLEQRKLDTLKSKAEVSIEQYNVVLDSVTKTKEEIKDAEGFLVAHKQKLASLGDPPLDEYREEVKTTLEGFGEVEPKDLKPEGYDDAVAAVDALNKYDEYVEVVAAQEGVVVQLKEDLQGFEDLLVTKETAKNEAHEAFNTALEAFNKALGAEE